MSKRLGKGINALFPELVVQEEDQVVHIPLSQLRPNPYQPRKTFSQEAIDELAESIRSHGVIQPIVVRQALIGYDIIAGERRFRAAQSVGLETIPAVARNYNDRQAMEISLIENVQREDLNALEVAIAYQALMKQFNLTQEELAGKVGKSRSHVTNFLRLLTLPEEVIAHVSRGTITMGHAKALAGLKNDVQKCELVNQAIKKQWNVRELEKAVKKLNQENFEKEQTKKNQDLVKRNPYLEEIETSLRHKFQTTVHVKNNRGNGQIELLYYGESDLERLLELLQIKT